MSILRIHKKQHNFVILDKTCLTDPTLSWGAKGIHAYLMSLPDDWRVKVSELKTHATNGRDSVRALLSELEQAGYIIKSLCRNSSNGKFGGLEYAVYEVPVLKNEGKIPGPENTSSVGNPGPEIPAPGIPAPANPTLLSNKNNNNLLNKKAAAEMFDLNKKTQTDEKCFAAAAFSHSEKMKETHSSLQPTKQDPHDALIGKTLTANQVSRVNALAQKLNVSGNEEGALAQEIQHCLLSPNHFKACGQDFNHKLNAIRTVILRGEWQTPASLVLEGNEKTTSVTYELEQEIQKAHAEVKHFQRLMSMAKDKTREGFETIVKEAKVKIKALEEKLYKSTAPPEALVT